MNIKKWFRRPAPVVHTCEICKTGVVHRMGNWDYCENGHVYVGARADEIPSEG